MYSKEIIERSIVSRRIRILVILAHGVRLVRNVSWRICRVFGTSLLIALGPGMKGDVVIIDKIDRDCKK